MYDGRDEYKDIYLAIDSQEYLEHHYSQTRAYIPQQNL